MKILVTIKRVPDTDQRIRVADDGQAIQDDGFPYVINPFDAIAVEEAIRIRETLDQDTEILTVGIGGEGYETELRTSLAMGADRAVWVQTDDLLDPWMKIETIINGLDILMTNDKIAKRFIFLPSV